MFDLDNIGSNSEDKLAGIQSEYDREPEPLEDEENEVDHEEN